MKRKGFTLVELLIVIAILGALAAMMTLSGTNATASADASKIVNDLLAVRTSALMFYFDYPDVHNQKKGSAAVEDDPDTTDVDESKAEVPGWSTTTGAEAKFSTVLKDYVDTTLSGNTTTADFILRIFGADDDTKASNAAWYVGYKIPTDTPDTVKERIAGQVTKYSLKGATDDSELSAAPEAFETTHGVLYIKVR